MFCKLHRTLNYFFVVYKNPDDAFLSIKEFLFKNISYKQLEVLNCTKNNS